MPGLLAARESYETAEASQVQSDAGNVQAQGGFALWVSRAVQDLGVKHGWGHVSNHGRLVRVALVIVIALVTERLDVLMVSAWVVVAFVVKAVSVNGLRIDGSFLSLLCLLVVGVAAAA